MQDQNDNLDIISESEHFAIWRSEEEDGSLFHIELGGITLHLMADEWEEFLTLINDVN